MRLEGFKSEVERMSIMALDELEEALMYEKRALEMSISLEPENEKILRQLPWVLEKLSIVKRIKAQRMG